MPTSLSPSLYLSLSAPFSDFFACLLINLPALPAFLPTNDGPANTVKEFTFLLGNFWLFDRYEHSLENIAVNSSLYEYDALSQRLLKTRSKFSGGGEGRGSMSSSSSSSSFMQDRYSTRVLRCSFSTGPTSTDDSPAENEQFPRRLYISTVYCMHNWLLSCIFFPNWSGPIYLQING